MPFQKRSDTSIKDVIAQLYAIPENPIDDGMSMYKVAWFRGWNAFREELHYILRENFADE